MITKILYNLFAFLAVLARIAQYVVGVITIIVVAFAIFNDCGEQSWDWLTWLISWFLTIGAKYLFIFLTLISED